MGSSYVIQLRSHAQDVRYFNIANLKYTLFATIKYKCILSIPKIRKVRRMQDSSIEGRFDRRLQLLLKCTELTIYQICLRIFLEPGLQGRANRALGIELFCCGIILLPIRKAEKETPTTKEIN